MCAPGTEKNVRYLSNGKSLYTKMYNSRIIYFLPYRNAYMTPFSEHAASFDLMFQNKFVVSSLYPSLSLCNYISCPSQKTNNNYDYNHLRDLQAVYPGPKPPPAVQESGIPSTIHTLHRLIDRANNDDIPPRRCFCA